MKNHTEDSKLSKNEAAVVEKAIKDHNKAIESTPYLGSKRSDKLGDQSKLLLASSGQRFGNYIIDGIFRVFIILIIWPSSLSHFPLQMNDIVVIMMVALFYYVPFEAFWGRTIGKLITGTKAVNHNGDSLTFWKAVGRTLCRFIPFEAFTFLSGRRPEGWHDRITKTKVVSVRND